jgi:hypothetical protein
MPKPKKSKAKTNGGPRKGSALAKVAGMLRRPKGVTRKEVLAATGWTAVSMQQQAKAAGMKLKINKSERPFTYRAAG